MKEPIKLFKTPEGLFLLHQNQYRLIEDDWDGLVNRPNLYGYLADMRTGASLANEKAKSVFEKGLLAPAGRQEVWAAGVTYLRSREARMEESAQSGAADFYDKVYAAERPELFFKSLPHRLSGHGQPVYIRRDSSWNVPEPELTLFINADGEIQGYTIGNDMSSRSIEGENPLYLPQAKVYEKSAALGPCLYIPEQPIDPETLIQMSILRAGNCVFKDSVSIRQMKRSTVELASYLYRECDFPWGSFLMTGTCIVPPPELTLAENDQVDIQIEPIGILSNKVLFKPPKQRMPA